MKKKFLAVLACGMLMLGLTGVTYAVPITINITANVSYVDDAGGLLDQSIRVGDILTGHYTYDTATPDSNTFESVGDYWYNSSPYGIAISGGGFIFETDPLNTNFIVEIVNDHYTERDNYLLRSYNNLPLSNGTLVEHIAWQLDDDTKTALSGTELTTSAPNLPDWQSVFGLTITGGNAKDPYLFGGKEFFIRANVTSAEIVATTPEPTTMLLLVTGIIGFAGLRKKFYNRIV